MASERASDLRTMKRVRDDDSQIKETLQSYLSGIARHSKEYMALAMRGRE